MEIIIQPPQTVLYILIGILVVIIASMLLKKGDRKKKMLSLVITVVVMAVVIFFVYRKGSIIVDDGGIRTNTFGKIEVSWDEIDKAEYIEAFDSTNYGLKSKLSGVGIGELKAGLFLLKGGDRARIVVQKNEDALLLRAGDKLYLLAPDQLDSLVSEAAKYIDIE